MAGFSEGGSVARVVGVVAGGPAAAAGLMSGDRIVALDGAAVSRLRGPFDT